jgi:hypothetical protein
MVSIPKTYFDCREGFVLIGGKHSRNAACRPALALVPEAEGLRGRLLNNFHPRLRLHIFALALAWVIYESWVGVLQYLNCKAKIMFKFSAEII